MPSDSDQPHDVRMRGFTSRTKVEDVLRWVDRHSQPSTFEIVHLAHACGRVLAAPIIADIDIPPFDRAAMDGYAVQAADTFGAGDYNPLCLRLAGQSFPGTATSASVTTGTAVQIMTGAPMPAGADAVVPAEYATESAGQVEITQSVTPGKHVGRRGEDVQTGTELFRPGRRLRPQDVGLLAAIGRDHIPLVTEPRVQVVVTGNELVAPGQPRAAGQIFESNSIMLNSLIKRDGGIVDALHFCGDDREIIRETLAKAAASADVVLISGGSSVGAEDHAPGVLAELGELAIHGIAMRPSSPAGMGQVGRAIVYLLPGNPVSCLAAYDFFAGRAIRRMGGLGAHWSYSTRLEITADKIVSAIGRVDYCRVVVDKTGVRPLSLSGASILSSTTRADGFVVVPANLEGYAAGSPICVYMYDPQPAGWPP